MEGGISAIPEKATACRRRQYVFTVIDRPHPDPLPQERATFVRVLRELSVWTF
jgi:hypothetical protein